MHLSTGCLLNVPLPFFLSVSSRFALALPRGRIGVSRSVLGETFDSTPMVLPIREHLDVVKRLLLGDYYIGRGSRQRGLGRSTFCNDFKVAVYGRQEAINRFAYKLSTDAELRGRLWTLSGLRLLCGSQD